MQCLATLNEHDHVPEEDAAAGAGGTACEIARREGLCAPPGEWPLCGYGLGTLCRGKFTRTGNGEPIAKGVVNNGEWCLV